MVVGGIVGAVSALSFIFITPILEKKGISDIAGKHKNTNNKHKTKTKNKKLMVTNLIGVHNLHGLPGLLGGVAGIVSAAIVTNGSGDVFGQPQADLYRRVGDQAGYQAAALAVSLAIGLGSGVLVGLVLWVLQLALSRANSKYFASLKMFFSDETNWMVPSDFERTRDPFSEAVSAETQPLTE